MRRPVTAAMLAAALLQVMVVQTASAAEAGACDAGPSHFSIGKVMEAAYAPKPGLVLLAAHRGYWRKAPENSIAALEEASKRNIETIEIDVRLDGEGTPWLLHDFALDRLTTGGGYLSGNNTATVKTVNLRDRQGQATNTPMETLDDALNYLGRTLHRDSAGVVRGFVLAIDLKSPPSSDPNATKVSGYEALKASWARVVAVSKNYPDLWPGDSGPVLGRAIIFKLKAKEVPDKATFEDDFRLRGEWRSYLHVEPVMHGDDSASGNRVIKAYFEEPYVIGYEPSAEFVDQPNTSQWIRILKDQKRTVPGFASWYDYPEGVAFSSGVCCLSRNTNPADRNHPLDYTASWDFSLQIGADWLTADTAPFLHDYLALMGRRDLNQIC